MLKSIKESPLYPIVNPKSIAFFGASNNMTAMGTSQLMSLLALGFEGGIYPVHPKEELVQGLKAYRSVLDLPEVPDLAVMVLEECGEKGIKHAIIVSGGFKEVGGQGPELEKEIIEIADRHGICFLGPNCIGVANPHHKLNTTFLQHEGPPGFIGFASQSGSFVTQMFNYLAGYGIGFSTAFSVGNEANVDIVDCIEYLGACPNTKVIGLYIEGINRGRAFIETAKAIVPEKPIVALYVGGSEAGKLAGFSHTGAMAGPDRLYDGMFSQSGIIRAQSATELFDFCWALGSLPKPKGPGVVIQTHSGGPGAAAADSCGRAGLKLPSLSEKTIEKLAIEKLAPFVPHTGSINNPVDLTFTKNPLDYFSEIPKALIEDDNTDILLMYFLMPSHTIKRALEQMGLTDDQVKEQSARLIGSQGKSIARLFEAHDKPVVGYTFRSLKEQFIRELLERGVPVFPGPERAARAIKALVRYTELREKIMAGKVKA
ncbi:MAG: CoA-binding protein, partial [Deltaproteobacteria bacterium]|nr:CoA-binding protein [Deltaproteobacteria bacterium]